jgi:hypothetical protein
MLVKTSFLTFFVDDFPSCFDFMSADEKSKLQSTYLWLNARAGTKSLPICTRGHQYQFYFDIISYHINIMAQKVIYDHVNIISKKVICDSYHIIYP